MSAVRLLHYTWCNCCPRASPPRAPPRSPLPSSPCLSGDVAAMAVKPSLGQELITSLFSSLPAAQLDNIGFSIIKKCIHAVETRGRALHQMVLFGGRPCSCS